MTEINERYQSTENLQQSGHNSNSCSNSDNHIRLDARQNLRCRSVKKHLLHKLNELAKLSVSQQKSINIDPDPFDIFEEDSSESGAGDTMANYRGTKVAISSPIGQTPLCREPNADKGIFNVARRKKVELQNLSPKVSDLSSKSIFCSH